jgi:dihydroorotase
MLERFPTYNARVIYTKRCKIVKNEHARYTLERFPTYNARVIYTQKVSENTVLCIKHNFQLKLVCSIHSVALLNIIPFKSKKFFIGLYIERINCV